MKMKHIDALHILGLSADYDRSLHDEFMTIIKMAYRQACSKYHPDRNPAGLEMMKMVNAAYDALSGVLEGLPFDNSIKTEKEGAQHYGEKINSALNAILDLGLNVEICGSWIWVSGNTRPYKEILKSSGFKWAPKKEMWHFRPEEYKSFSRGKWSMEQIRTCHGSQTIKRKPYQQIEDRA